MAKPKHKTWPTMIFIHELRIYTTKTKFNMFIGHDSRNKTVAIQWDNCIVTAHELWLMEMWTSDAVYILSTINQTHDTQKWRRWIDYFNILLPTWNLYYSLSLLISMDLHSKLSPYNSVCGTPLELRGGVYIKVLLTLTKDE